MTPCRSRTGAPVPASCARWAALAVVAMACLAPRAPAQQPPAAVLVDDARLEEVVRQRRVTGEIRAARRSILAAQSEGLVVAFDLDPGDTVRKGQVIARLDADLAELAVANARALREAAGKEIQRLEKQLAFDRREAERARAAAELRSVNPSELDTAETAVATGEAQLARAEADLAAADAALATAQRQLEDKTVTAPFAGRVVETSTDLGAWIGFGDPIIELVDLTSLEARIDVPEQLLPYLPMGRITAADTSDGTPSASSRPLFVPLVIPGVGQTEARPALSDQPGADQPGADQPGTDQAPGDPPRVTGRPISIVPAADAVSRIFTVRLALSGPADRLLPFMSLTAMVPTGDREPFVTIHKDAIQRNTAGEFVYAAVPAPQGPGGPPGGGGGPGQDTGPALQAAPIPVESLFAVGERVAIRRGPLEPGTPVITRGNERLYPTQPVRIIRPDGATPPAGERAAEANAGFPPDPAESGA